MSDTKTTTGKIQKSEAEWRKELTPMQYAVLREKATERPFSGEYEHEHRAGTCGGHIKPCGQLGHGITAVGHKLALGGLFVGGFGADRAVIGTASQQGGSG